MRHLLAAAAVVLMAGPAMAVDYLQCEAMQNAKERIIKSRTAIQVEIAKAAYSTQSRIRNLLDCD